MEDQQVSAQRLAQDIVAATLGLSGPEQASIQATADNNTYFFLYALNKVTAQRLASTLAAERFDTLANQLPFLQQSLTDCFIVFVKQSLLPTITHEYNLLKQNNFLPKEEEFNYFIGFISNSEDWISYFFDKYPALTDLLAQALGYFCESSGEFLRRLDADLPQLAAQFALASPLVKGLNAFAGDLHNGWRATVEVSFTDAKVYYKPRTLRNEVAFYGFLSFLQSLGLPKSAESVPVLQPVRGAYGWMKGVDYQPASDLAELTAFYFNQGINLAIAYFLGIADLIGDNITVVGQYPVFYDLECLLQPTLLTRAGQLYDHANAASLMIAGSVLRTGLLPQFGFQTETHPGVSNAGLSLITEADILPQLIIEFEDGQFKRHFKKLPFDSPNTAIPSLPSGERFRTSQFFTELLSGFREAFGLFMAHKEVIAQRLTEVFTGLSTRILYRSTFIYARLINEVFHPQYLASPAKTSTLFATLANAKELLTDSETIIESEIRQISRLNVPVFHAMTDGHALYDEQLAVLLPDFFQATGVQEAVARIRQASSSHLAIQSELVETSFIIHESMPSEKPSVSCPPLLAFKQGRASSPPAGRRLLLEEAEAIATRILGAALYQDGVPSFWGITQSPNYTWVLTSKRFGFFDGTDGLAFFFLNLYKLTGQATYLAAGTTLVETAINQFAQYASYYDQPNSFNKNSLFNYPLSSFYVAEFFVRSGFPVPSLTEHALDKLAAWIADAIDKDRDYDILSGNAGCIVYLCKLFERTGKQQYLRLAEKAANHILQNAHPYEGTVCWSNIHQKGFLGFSHGSSGIAYALLKVNQYLKREDIRATALQAIEYERLLFDRRGQVWPFFMFTDSNLVDYYPNHFWAYGSGSIALSRILISPHYQDEMFAEEIAIAQANILSKGPTVNHNISSGLFGNLYVLEKIAAHRNDHSLRELVELYTQSVLATKAAGELWRGAPVGKNNAVVEMDGLLTGSSGIGYVLTKLADPEHIDDFIC